MVVTLRAACAKPPGPPFQHKADGSPSGSVSFEIFSPELLTGLHLDRRDDKIRPFQGSFVGYVAGNRFWQFQAELSQFAKSVMMASDSRLVSTRASSAFSSTLLRRRVMRVLSPKGRTACSQAHDFGHGCGTKPSCRKMLAAALRPAPIALMTVAPPVTISPPA